MGADHPPPFFHSTPQTAHFQPLTASSLPPIVAFSQFGRVGETGWRLGNPAGSISMSKGMFGECLKREREMREVSLQEVCAATRISTRFLQAMENEDWEKLPGGVFNRGFVRSVSRYLGLDEEAMLAEYDIAFSERAGAPAPVLPPQPIPRSFPGWFPFLILLLCAGIIAGGIYGWHRLSLWRRAQNAPSTSSQTKESAPLIVASAPIRAASRANDPEASDPKTPPPSPSSSARSSILALSVAIAISTRVRVTADGHVLLDRRLNAGEIRHFRARSQFVVSTGDSGGVLLELNGQTMPPLGPPGSPGKISLSWKDLKKEPGGTH